VALGRADHPVEEREVALAVAQVELPVLRPVAAGHEATEGDAAPGQFGEALLVRSVGRIAQRPGEAVEVVDPDGLERLAVAQEDAARPHPHRRLEPRAAGEQEQDDGAQVVHAVSKTARERISGLATERVILSLTPATSRRSMAWIRLWPMEIPSQSFSQRPPGTRPSTS